MIQVAPELGVSMRRLLPDGRVIDLLPLFHGWRIAIGKAGSVAYDDLW